MSIGAIIGIILGVLTAVVLVLYQHSSTDAPVDIDTSETVEVELGKSRIVNEEGVLTDRGFTRVKLEAEGSSLEEYEGILDRYEIEVTEEGHLEKKPATIEDAVRYDILLDLIHEDALKNEDAR